MCVTLILTTDTETIPMVIQKAIDGMKDKPKDDKKAVAGGIAVAVVIVLLIGWSILFLKKLQRGDADLQIQGAGQEFLGEDVRAAQEALMQSFDDLDELRRAAEQGGAGNVQEGVEQSIYYDDTSNSF